MSDAFEETIRAIVARLTNTASNAVKMESWPTQYGLDSLSLLIFREQCESEFKIFIPDGAWAGMTRLSDVTKYAEDNAGAVLRSNSESATSPETVFVPSVLSHEHDMFERIEIGMPLTGINHLSENALLKYVGDLRWRHLTRVSGVASRNLIDDEGHRLYPAFFYVESNFPVTRPMSSYGENDVLYVVDSMRRYGHSMLDGFSYLISEEQAKAIAAPIESPEQAHNLGVPSVRLSNIFVKQFSGADWLKKGRPADGLIDRVAELSVAPDCSGVGKRAEETGYIQMPGRSYLALHTDAVEYDYKIQPDRDVNGVGLLYFANYPVFLDLAERDALKKASPALTDDLINRRSIVSRKVAYLNNASWKDSVKIQTRSWIDFSDGKNVRLFTNHLMHRVSDGRLMCVCSADKVFHALTVDAFMTAAPQFTQ